MTTHLDVWAAETAVPSGEAAWLTWIDQAEALAGHSLDGDEPSGDAYSMDSAYAAWEQGRTPAEYVTRIHSNTSALEAS